MNQLLVLMLSLRQDMWKVVESLRKTGVTIILTTHYIEEAEAIADRVGSNQSRRNYSCR